MKVNKERATTLQPYQPENKLNVTNLYTAYSYYYSPTFFFKGESHSAIEFLYVNAGEVVVETDVSDEPFILTKGQFLFHKPYEFHKIRANNIACNVYILTFDCECAHIDKLYDKIFTATPYQAQLAIKLVTEGMDFLEGKNWIPTINKDKEPTFASGQLTKTLLESFLIDIIRSQLYEKTEKESQHETQHNEATILELAKTYMSNNITRKLTLDEISSAIGYSTPHLCSVFKKNLGISVMTYFIQIRVKKVKQLIEEGKLTFKQISELMNYDTVQYFSTQFKKVAFCTPSQYAKTIKTKNIYVVTEQDN